MLSKVEWTTTGTISVTRWIQKTSYDDKQVNSQKGLNGLKSRAEDKGKGRVKVKHLFINF